MRSHRSGAFYSPVSALCNVHMYVHDTETKADRLIKVMKNMIHGCQYYIDKYIYKADIRFFHRFCMNAKCKCMVSLKAGGLKESSRFNTADI